jgi:hypothetical protein
MYFDNVYTEQIQPNGDILLIKKNLLIKDFIWVRSPNGDILLKPVKKIKPYVKINA